MPRKSQTANNPLGFSALGGAASLGNNVSNEIGKRSPRASMDCGQIQMPNQVILVPKKRRGRGQGVIIGKLLIANGSETGKYKITDGKVNFVTPTLGGTLIDNDPPPEITVTADTWVYIKVVGTFADPDTYVVTIETEAAATPPTGTDITASGFTSFFYIGRVDFTSGTPDTFTIINSHSGGNLGVESFGNVNLWWKS